jgi:hypothetical protein
MVELTDLIDKVNNFSLSKEILQIREKHEIPAKSAVVLQVLLEPGFTEREPGEVLVCLLLTLSQTR